MKRTCAQPVVLGLCPKLKYPPFYGGIFILVVVSLAALSLPAAFLSADDPAAELTGHMEELRIGLGRCRSDAREAIGNRIQSGAYDVARSWAAYEDHSALPTDSELCFLLAVWSVSNCDWQAFWLHLDEHGAILYPVQAVEREDDGMFYLAATLEPLCLDAAWELLAVDPNAICPDTGLGNRQTVLMRCEGMKRIGRRCIWFREPHFRLGWSRKKHCQKDAKKTDFLDGGMDGI